MLQIEGVGAFTVWSAKMFPVVRPTCEGLGLGVGGGGIMYKEVE